MLCEGHRINDEGCRTITKNVYKVRRRQFGNNQGNNYEKNAKNDNFERNDGSNQNISFKNKLKKRLGHEKNFISQTYLQK